LLDAENFPGKLGYTLACCWAYSDQALLLRVVFATCFRTSFFTPKKAFWVFQITCKDWENPVLK